MLTRIVKMEFKQECVPEFLVNFEKDKLKIRAFHGCQFLELYQDKSDAATLFTYSKWNTEEDLESYRKSDLFNGVWTTTKAMFRSRAQAWSVDTLHTLS